ncbi:hypothetical protein [Streptomyces sp. NPDC127084]|uniref:hypothetical protein n=1 Tax=Streptomyces sp. NPDC127084 TaxID=3347133 RepID=UPI0036632B25
MIVILAALSLLVWLVGIVLLAISFTTLLADEPRLRLAAELSPVAVALYAAVVIAFWPAAVLASVIELLGNRERQ